MYLFGSCCLVHDCLTGCLSVLTVVSVRDRVEIWTYDRNSKIVTLG